MTESGDLSGLFSQVEALRSQLASARSATAETAVEGRSGQGAVRVGLRGEFEFTSVHLDPELLDGGDAALIEDLVLAAVRDAVTRLVEAQHQALGTAASDAITSLLGGTPTGDASPTD